MKSPIPTCPPPGDLERFALGLIAEEDAERLEGHLADCARCLETIAFLKPSDTLFDAVRSGAGIARETVDPELIDRLCHLTASGRVAQGDTLPQASETKDLCHFLAEPQGRDEIGRLGPYRVLRLIGHGGMGVVFEAEDAQLKRRVALKAMKPALAASDLARRRFLREAQATAAIEHDHVVTIYQVGEDRGVPFLAMQLLHGESLADRLAHQGKLPVREVLRIGREIALGLAAAHQHGLIHRDIKPANIWLEASTRTKILDFGLTRAIDDTEHLTQTSAITGTPAYMSPEQAQGEPVDQHSDLFSLGCVLYRCLTGEPPFQGKSPMATLLAVTASQPRSPQQIDSNVPPELSDFVMKLLSKEAAQRPATAVEVAATLSGIRLPPCSAPDAVSPGPGGTDCQSVLQSNACSAPDPLASGPAQEVETTAQPPHSTSQPPRVPAGGRGRAARFAIAAAALLAAFAAFEIIFVATDRGKLVIELRDPNVELKIDPKSVVIEDRTGQRRYDVSVGHSRMPSGEYAIRVAEDSGLRFDTNRFTIERGGETRVKVWFEPADAARLPAKFPPLDSDWVKRVQSLSADEQVREVEAELKRRNPGFPGIVSHQVGALGVYDLNMPATELRDITPLAAFRNLGHIAFCPRKAGLIAADARRTPLADLSPLKGLPLAVLDISLTSVTDLSPLKGMPLRVLSLDRTDVQDLSPLAGSQISTLLLSESKVTSLEPLRGLPLKELFMVRTKVDTLEPLAGAPLRTLHASGTPIRDLTPLARAPLEVLRIDDTRVTDLSPLLDAPLKKLWVSPETIARIVEILKKKSTLETINWIPVAEFWKTFDPNSATRPVFPPLDSEWVKRVQALSADEQVREVEAELKRRNPGFLGIVRHQADAGGVFNLNMPAVELRDITPLAVWTNLTSIAFCPREAGLIPAHARRTPLADLSPLKGQPLAILDISLTSVTDLRPLKGMPLRVLSLEQTLVQDLLPLAECPIGTLRMGASRVASLEPLRGLPLIELFITHTKVDTLEPLAGAALRYLDASGAPIRDLAPLARAPLEGLAIAHTRVTDLSPLMDAPLKVLYASPETIARNVEILKKKSTLARINGIAAAEIWKTFDPNSAVLDDGVTFGFARTLSGVIPGFIPRPGPLAGIKRWQLETRTPRGRVHDVAWSPDGSQVACGTDLGHVRIYDSHSGELRVLLAAHRGRVLALDWSRDGQWLVSGGADTHAQLWRPDGSPGPTLTDHEGWVHAVAFRPDGQAIATAGHNTIRLWGLDGKQLSIVGRHADLIVDLDWSPDGKHFASASRDGTVTVWSAAGEPSLTLDPEKKTGRATAVAWSPDGETLATGTAEQKIHLWSRDGKLLSERSQGSFVHTLAWNKDGLLAAGSDNGEIRVWDAEGQILWSEKTGLGRILDIAWTAQGDRLAAGSDGVAIHVRDRQGTKVADLRGRSPFLPSVAWSTSGKIAASTHHGGLVWLLTEEGKVDRVLEGHTQPVPSLSFDPTGRRLASGGWDSRVHVWDLEAGTKTKLTGGNPVAWHPKGDELAYGSSQGVRLWSPTGDRLLLPLDRVSVVAWTPNGSELTTGDFDGHIRHWNREGKQLAETKVPALVFALSWHPTRSLLASTSAAEIGVRIWDRELQPVRILSGHSVNVVGTRWSPDGQRLGSSGGDGLLRVWDVDGKLVHDLRPATAPSQDVCFSPDGRRVAGVGMDGTLSTYRVDTGEPEFVFVAFEGKQWLSLSAKGTIIDGDVKLLQDNLIVLVEQADGRNVSYSFVDFQQKFPAAFDRDRPVAEWVLSIGGSVTLDVNGKEVAVNAAKDLPSGAWKVRSITAQHVWQVKDADLKALAGLTHLRDLKLDHSQVTDVGLKELAGLSQLQSLSLWHAKVTDVGLKELAGLKQLQALELLGTPVTDAGLKELAGLKQLRDLNLSSTQVTDAGLKDLAGLKQLRALSLIGAPVTGTGFKELAGLTQLEALWLGGIPATDAGFKELAKLKQLRVLALFEVEVTDAVLKELGGLTELYVLLFNSPKVTDVGLKELAGLTKLQELRVYCPNVTDAGLKELAKLKQLSALGLANTQVTDAGLKELAGIKQLRTLFLNKTQVTDAGLKELAGLKQLKHLELRDTKVTRAGVERLHQALPKCHFESDFGGIGQEHRPETDAPAAPMPAEKTPPLDPDLDRRVAVWAHSLGGTVGVSVRGRGFVMVKPEEPLPNEITDLVQAHLGGSNVPVRDEDLARLDALRLFTVLGLTKSSITDAGLKRLGRLPELHSLYLGDTKISDAGMAELARFPRLSVLHIGGPAITVTDAGIKSLARLPLTDLRVGQCPITDASLDALRDMKTLRMLLIPQTKVTRAGVERLHQALPECRIESDFGAVGPEFPPAKKE